MNREEFIKQLDKGESLTEEERKTIISQFEDHNSVYKNCVICIEELAELQQEISKIIRMEDDKSNYGLLEEIADVVICLQVMLSTFDIDDKTLYSAIDVKLSRGKERFDNEIKELARIQKEVFAHNEDY